MKYADRYGADACISAEGDPEIGEAMIGYRCENCAHFNWSRPDKEAGPIQSMAADPKDMTEAEREGWHRAWLNTDVARVWAHGMSQMLTEIFYLRGLRDGRKQEREQK